MTTAPNKYAPKFSSPGQESKALVMLAARCTAVEVAAALGAHPQTIRALAKKPGNPEYIAGLRQRIKVESTEVLHRTRRSSPAGWRRRWTSPGWMLKRRSIGTSATTSGST
jgi:hypothetical protein